MILASNIAMLVLTGKSTGHQTRRPERNTKEGLGQGHTINTRKGHDPDHETRIITAEDRDHSLMTDIRENQSVPGLGLPHIVSQGDPATDLDHGQVLKNERVPARCLMLACQL